ncbi:mechanosensitive ion channel domain-containing protein [Sinimarinibacterium flocculans]|uniref:mechanosensitive ion channel domain-containing protein n=1 Tax=Sinimarinibacterium flocculans TaxID=985250 RepID=UPI00248FD5A2|nr:mechanosensitive ion channel family protein [Sinimarinibacterium flocculans]
MKDLLPVWAHGWLNVIVPAVQVVLVLAVAVLLRVLVHRVIRRTCERYRLPTEMAVGMRRGSGFLIYGAALLLCLERVGVSGMVLWTAFTGFATVGAVAFFAAWSVLSNIFCMLLIATTRPFRLHDQIEVLESGDKPGLKGRVLDINLIYTTLEESGENGAGTLLQIPNSLFFQRITRRWQ